MKTGTERINLPISTQRADPLRITVKMLDIRDDMRALFGEHYAERVEPFLAAIQRWTKESGKPVAEVALECAQGAEKHGNGMSLALAIAAGVEAMERRP